MNATTRRILIIVCVIAFLLTSTFTWGVISAGIDASKRAADDARELAKHGVTRSGQAIQWTFEWVLAHGNALVPVLFLGGIVWLMTQKPQEANEAKA